MDLENQRIVVLGGTSGIGLAVAEKAAAQGAAIVVASSNEDNVKDAKKRLSGTAQGFTVDLASEESIKSFFSKIGEFNHLVYTAGDSLLTERLETLSLERARKFFDIRFWGAFLAVKYGAPSIRRGGSVVLSSGMASRRPARGRSMVSSVCGAAEALTRSLAVELAPLRINLVCPGLVKTELWSGMAPEAREELFSRAERILPVGRAGEAEDLAEAYVYLMKNGFSTGQVVVVDGGASVV
jgi:NAD(P)-dependent dehydrogenase (short-subunit alcohol dehydrogenase family)